MKRFDLGFSLIELMLVLAIVGILSAIAYPNYIDSVRKGRRAEPISVLLELAVAQERIRAGSANYVTDMTRFGYANSGANNLDSGFYSVQISSADTTSEFTITASEVAGTDQANDSCGNFVITEDGPDFTGGNADRGCWNQ